MKKAPRELDKGQLVARLVGCISGMRDHIGAAKDEIMDISARCVKMKETNEKIKLLTNGQLETLDRIQSFADANFDKWDQLLQEAGNINEMLRG